MNIGSITETKRTFDMPGADRFETRSITFFFQKRPFACRERFQLLTSLPTLARTFYPSQPRIYFQTSKSKGGLT